DPIDAGVGRRLDRAHDDSRRVGDRDRDAVLRDNLRTRAITHGAVAPGLEVEIDRRPVWRAIARRGVVTLRKWLLGVVQPLRDPGREQMGVFARDARA